MWNQENNRFAHRMLVLLLIVIIKMMQNVVECYSKCSKKETEKHIVHTVYVFLMIVLVVLKES